MPRTSSAKILDWGTPPEPEPTGWDAIKAELGNRPGEWASIGEFSTATSRKLSTERFPTAEGYEVRSVPTKTDGRVSVWVRMNGATGTETPEEQAARLETRAAQDAAVAETAADLAAGPKPRTVKRGSVV